jgi:hypothetical protein
LLNRVLVRPGFDEDALVQADIGGPQDVFPAVGGEGHVVEPPRRSRPVVGVYEVVGLLREVKPLGRDCAVVQDDLLGDPGAEGVADEPAAGLALRGQEVHVIEATHTDPATRVGLRLVLQR